MRGVTVLAVISSILIFTTILTALAVPLAPAPQVSFTFDDGLKSSLEYAAPALADFGYTGTNYVISGCADGSVSPCPADEEAEYMTCQEVNSLRGDFGWEIGSHTVTHPLLDSTDPFIQEEPLTEEQMIAELANSKNICGIQTTAFAAPYGDYGHEVRVTAAKYYTSFRGFKDVIDLTNPKLINDYPYNDHLIKVLQVQAGVSVDDVKIYVDHAAATNSWLVMVFHEVKPAAIASTDPDDYEYAVEDLREIAAYVQSKNISVSNVSDALVSVSPDPVPVGGVTDLMPGGSGDFEGITLEEVTSYTPSDTNWVTPTPYNESTDSGIKIDTGNNGSFPSSTTSVFFAGGSVANFLFSPKISVEQGQTYIIKMYINVFSITSGELGLYVHEYDQAGNEISGQWIVGLPDVWVEGLNRPYAPSPGTDKVSLEIYTTAGSDARAYIDNVQWLAEFITTLLDGDVNGDQFIDMLDLSTILGNWNKLEPGLGDGDANNDGVVDMLDISVVLTNWSI